MHAETCEEDHNGRQSKATRPMKGNLTGVWVTYSDTITADSRVPFIPFWEGRRQTEHAARWSTIIPCFLYPHSKISFGFWIQPVAAKNEVCLRQLKSDHVRPEKAEGTVANYSQESFRLQVLSMGNLPKQVAAFTPNLEVSTCR